MKINLSSREMKIGNRTIYIVGANDERASAKIQGSTLLGALVDEASILPQSVWQMLMSRLSLPGSRLYATSNPDSPYHWLKTDWIDRSEELGAKVWHFGFDDNPSLTPDFKAQLAREYVGLWYQRYIEGKWVLAEGTIYDFFDPKEHVIKMPPGAADYYVVGVDYGTINPCVFTLIAYSNRTQPNMWIEDEWYWDSSKRLIQKTDAEYAEDLKKFIAGKNVKAIYIDPAAASLKAECNRIGVHQMYDANNDVLNGIRYVSTLIKMGTLRVCSCCQNHIKEFGSYVWDNNAARRGEDKPKKEHDHAMDAARYGIFTHFFNRVNPAISREEFTRVRDEFYYGADQNMPPMFRQPH
jgi:PBSX family phage terminase large subunit